MMFVHLHFPGQSRTFKKEKNSNNTENSHSWELWLHREYLWTNLEWMGLYEALCHCWFISEWLKITDVAQFLDMLWIMIVQLGTAQHHEPL